MSLIISGLLFMLLLFSATAALAQQNPAFLQYPNNHLKWYTIESTHFLVHFQEGNSRPAQVISRIAEEVYFDITDLYDHEPDSKVSIVLIDREDYSNGAAYFFDNKIDIWLPALDTRGYGPVPAVTLPLRLLGCPSRHDPAYTCSRRHKSGAC
ncbi:MAG: hypothetical protein LC662_10780 [Rhodothermaceae bacterium]|nr:hypothetical protein [Rhodothermaceae bacterium]